MAKRKKLSKKQLAVIEDLFSGQFDEQAVLEKHNVSRAVYNRWLADEQFDDEFSRRIASAHRQSELIIARYAPLAAAKLVQLTDSEKEETARRACLDIISLPKFAAKESEQSSEPQSASDKQAELLPPTTCSILLAALAEADRKEE